MKRKKVNDRTIINGYYVNEVAQGFFGEQNEGKQMLKAMGLPENSVPFSAAVFLQNQKIFWLDANGKRAFISFKVKPDQIECHGSYLGKRKIIRIFREWGFYEDPTVVKRLESEALGNLCMRCIFENLF